MRMVRGRRDARWLPSRHNLAIFRLGAYLRGRTSTPEPAEIILFVDRFQSAFETFSLAILTVLMATCYIAATLFGSWPIAGALAIAFPIAILVVHVPFFMLAPLLVSLERKTRLHVQSAGMMLMCVAVSAWFATSESWARFAAWPVLTLAGLNAIAALILVLMRERIAQFESSFGGSASAL